MICFKKGTKAQYCQECEQKNDLERENEYEESPWYQDEDGNPVCTENGSPIYCDDYVDNYDYTC